MGRDYSKVMVIYCHCGERWATAGHPYTIEDSEIAQAVRDGRKIETISIEDYRANVSKFGCFEHCTK